MADPGRPWWRKKRVVHRDAVVLCVLSSAFLLAGELANPVLASLYLTYLAPVAGEPAIFAIRGALLLLGFTTAFGGILVFLGGWFFLRGKVPRGRSFVGLGVGLTSLSLASRVAYYTLVFGTPLEFLIPLATTLTGLGVLLGTIAHITMGRYVLLLKRQAWAVLRQWRRAHRTIPRGDRYSLRPFNGGAMRRSGRRAE